MQDPAHFIPGATPDVFVTEVVGKGLENTAKHVRWTVLIAKQAIRCVASYDQDIHYIETAVGDPHVVSHVLRFVETQLPSLLAFLQDESFGVTFTHNRKVALTTDLAFIARSVRELQIAHSTIWHDYDATHNKEDYNPPLTPYAFMKGMADTLPVDHPVFAAIAPLILFLTDVKELLYTASHHQRRVANLVRVRIFMNGTSAGRRLERAGLVTAHIAPFLLALPPPPSWDV
jgi:hypothetical protein